MTKTADFAAIMTGAMWCAMGARAVEQAATEYCRPHDRRVWYERASEPDRSFADS